jgi:hypothetical protein
VGRRKRPRVRFARAYTHDADDVGDEDFAVPNLPRLRCAHDRFHHLIDQLILDRNFDAGLWNEVHDIFRPAIQLGMPTLPAETLDLGDRHARDPDFGERGTHVVQLEGLYDGSDQFHSQLR